jgi:lipopolysaccharide transport system ATP-binding protein
MSSDVAIQTRGLSKSYAIFERPEDRLKQMLVRGRKKFYREFWALRDVSFEVRRAQTLGIVGRNGSGKSTLLQIICGTLTPTSGEIEVKGRIAALLELGAGFSPEFTGRENVYLNGAIIGLCREEIDERFDRIAAFAGIDDFIDQPLKTYSSGMYARLAFAVAINLDPDILVVDEALSVGDEAFQRKCFARIGEIKERGGTVLFVSHSASAVVELCDWAMLIDRGEVLVTDAPKKVIGYYHRLIFAPPERQEHVRRMLLEGRGDELMDQSLGGGNQEMPGDDVSSFDPHLRSESTIAYESRGAIIQDVHIATEFGRRVNVL